MNSKKVIGDLLQSHGLKRTPIRMQMLEIFMDSNFALSASELMSHMTKEQDRVTIYRALVSFEENGILHRASEDGQGAKYALCGHSCPSESHAEKHAHFVCDECHHTFCLNDVTIPEIKVSNDFSVNRVNYTLGGVCKTCRN